MINPLKLLNDNPPIDAWDQKAIDDFLGYMHGVALKNLVDYTVIVEQTGSIHADQHRNYWEAATGVISWLRDLNSKRRIDECLRHRDTNMPITTHSQGGEESQLSPVSCGQESADKPSLTGCYLGSSISQDQEPINSTNMRQQPLPQDGSFWSKAKEYRRKLENFL